ncbi:hypothetical protein LP419_11465 [Massilia sp. H-1]|nr:hypothetical protein LP419_11465 [Massilia sp. H-1]
MVANEGKDFLFQLPPDAFIDTDPGDTLRYELRNEFGKPLLKPGCSSIRSPAPFPASPALAIPTR